MVAFGIEDDQRVAEADQLFADQPGQVGLARSGAAADGDVELRAGQRDRLTVVVGAQRDLPAAGMQVHPAGQQRSQQQVGHPLAVRQRQHHIGVRAEGVDRIGDGHPDLAGLQQAVVVLGVADADRVVRRQAQLAERLEQAGALGHPGRQDHQLAPVADELAVQAQLTDHLQRGRLVGGGAGDQHLPAAVGDPPAGQRGTHRAADRGGQQADAAVGDQQAAVLGDDRVNVLVDVREHGAQLAHDPPGDQDHPDPPGPRLGERGHRGGRDLAISQGAVEVEGHRAEVAGPARGHALDQQPVRPPGAAEREHFLAAAGVDHESVESAGPDGVQCLSCLVQLQPQFPHGAGGTTQQLLTAAGVDDEGAGFRRSGWCAMPVVPRPAPGAIPPQGPRVSRPWLHPPSRRTPPRTTGAARTRRARHPERPAVPVTPTLPFAVEAAIRRGGGQCRRGRRRSS